MSIYTIQSAYMNLQIPVVLLDPGPQWASDVNACFTQIDAHDHSTGKGVQVTPQGLDINSDLSFQSINNAIDLRTSRFSPQPLPLATGGTDSGCVYVVGNELFYNDVTGNHQVQITTNGSVNAGAGSITGLPSGTASASYIALSGTFQWQQATSTAANMDLGTLVIRYPGSYPTPAGNYIALAAPSSLSSGYKLTLPGIPAQTNVVTLTSTGVFSSITYDQVAQAMTSVGANAIAATMTVTGADAIASKMDSTGANAVAASTSSPNFGGANIRGNSKAILLWQAGSPASLNVQTLFGLVQSSGAPGGGSGFSSVRNSLGNYTVTFSVAFTSTVIVTVSPQAAGFSSIAAQVGPATNSGFTYYTFNTATSAVDDFGCYFTVMGY